MVYSNRMLALKDFSLKNEHVLTWQDLLPFD